MPKSPAAASCSCPGRQSRSAGPHSASRFAAPQPPLRPDYLFATSLPMDRRPTSIPTRLNTPRLVLRPPMEADARDLNRVARDSYEWLHPWIPWAAQRPTLARTRKYCRDGARRYPLGEDMPLLMLHRESGELLGGTGLHRLDWSVPAVEIGYWVRQEHAGHGYVTEATKAVALFAFEVLGARRIEIRCDAENLPSRRVAERAGFPARVHPPPRPPLRADAGARRHLHFRAHPRGRSRAPRLQADRVIRHQPVPHPVNPENPVILSKAAPRSSRAPTFGRRLAA